MTSEKGSGPKKPSGGRRPGPTIDLKATEVSSEPIAGEAASTAEPSAAAQASGARFAPGDDRSGPSASVPPPDSGRAGSDWSRRPRDIWDAGWKSFSRNPSLQIAAAAVAAGLAFFTLGLVVAGWFAARSPTAMQTPPMPATGDVAARMQRLESRIEALLAAPRTPDPGVMQRLAAAESAAQRAAETTAILQRRNDEMAASLRDLRNRLDAAIVAVESAPKGSPVVADAAARGDIEVLKSRMAALENIQKELDQALKTNEAELARRATNAADDRASRFAVTALALLSAVERGAPFATEFASAKALGASANEIAALEPFAAEGIPSTGSLSRALVALVPALVQAVGREPQKDSGYLEKLQASAERLVRIRPVGESTGDRPVDMIARIEARAKSFDIAGALAELTRLPAENRAPAESWIKTAQAREGALVAARQLSGRALAAIGKPNT